MKKSSAKAIFPLFSLLFLAFLVYLLTKPPSILWIDSGTMLAASASLGIPNPPGFPFYMLSSHLFAQIMPFGSYLLKMETFTILFSLGLLFCIYKIILTILESNFFFFKRSGSNSEIINHKSSFINLPVFSASFGTLALAFSYQYWSQTQNTEAFIPTYFFVAFFVYLLILINIRKKAFLENKISFQRYSAFTFYILLLIAFLYGLAAGMNPTVAALVPAVLYVMWLNKKALSLGKLFILGLTFLVTIIAVYSYLPIRASTWPFVNWGNPQTLDLFLGHLHGRGLDIYEPESGSINGFTGSPLIFFQTVSYFLFNSLLQFTPVLFPFILAGMYITIKKNKYLFAFLISVPLLDLIYSGLYTSGNQESWFILSWMFFAVFIGLGFHFFVNKFSVKGKLYYLSFTLCFLPLIVFFTMLNRSWHTFSSDYAYNLYSNLEPNAILIGTGDFFNSLSHYLHEADKFRTDVTPLTANVFYVNQWSRDGLRKATNLNISKRIDEIIQYKEYYEYNQAMNEFIADNIDSRPIYVTHLTLRASALAATDGGQLRLDDRFKFLPYGLVLKVVRASESAVPDLSKFDFKFKTPLSNAPKYFERNYKAAFKNILNDYIYADVYLANWFVERKDTKNALIYYNKALEISKENSELLATLGTFYANLGDFNASRHYLEKAERLDVKNIAVHFNLGLSYMNLNMLDRAKLEFQSVTMLAPPGDPVIAEAEELLKKISALDLNDPTNQEATAGWIEFEDKKHNLRLKIPPELKRVTQPDTPTILLSNNKPGSFGLNIEIVKTTLNTGEDINKHIENSPLKMSGILLDTQPINLLGFYGGIQIFGTPSGDSSQRFILVKDLNVWQFKVYPGNSVKLSEFNKILSTFKPL